ncbi:N-acetylglucosaminyl-phosphatidylinositol [Rhypophila decipiens]|uniref:N-acetylglucosaminyl-phosphatidylinositol n=1 Tax=Rhypophila decipiens TaxID=261697 RepID=A0AAN6YCU7_9PEZI|nr:N-acetylglucosaminyl-phosphatidylinositol [Rhypophila decipiens]
MNNQQPKRPLTTHARVHPPYLPYLSNASSRGKGAKYLPPLLAAVALGYGVTAYREAQIERHLSPHSPTSYSSATLPTEKETQAEFEKRRKKFNELADAYGDRNSLEELEHAMRVYEAQQGNE